MCTNWAILGCFFNRNVGTLTTFPKFAVHAHVGCPRERHLVLPCVGLPLMHQRNPALLATIKDELDLLTLLWWIVCGGLSLKGLANCQAVLCHICKICFASYHLFQLLACSTSLGFNQNPRRSITLSNHPCLFLDKQSRVSAAIQLQHLSWKTALGFLDSKNL